MTRQACQARALFLHERGGGELQADAVAVRHVLPAELEVIRKGSGRILGKGAEGQGGEGTVRAGTGLRTQDGQPGFTVLALGLGAHPIRQLGEGLAAAMAHTEERGDLRPTAIRHPGRIGGKEAQQLQPQAEAVGVILHRSFGLGEEVEALRGA